MKLKRRNFLLLVGLGGFAAVLGGLWQRLTSADVHSATPPETALSELPSDKVSERPILRFVAIADAGSGDRNQYGVAEAMARYYQKNPYSLVVMAGDNIYTNGEMWKIGNVFEQPYKPLLSQGVKFRACLGNHDIRTQNGNLQVKYSQFNMQGRYYTFREQSVQFFVLDTNTNANWKAQLTWLEQELSRSNAPWKIVYGHHPIYSSGVYGTNPEMISMLVPLFKKYHVQLYINGHEHDYERTRSIDGTTYLITGIGGASLRSVKRSAWTEYAASHYGFTALEVFKDRLEIRAIDTKDKVFDRGIVNL
jgi:hypothetical protein